MTKFRIPKVNLDLELFARRNVFLASSVVLNALAHNDPTYQTEIFKSIRSERLPTPFKRFLFQNMIDMIKSQGQIDVHRLRLSIPSFAPNAPEFIEGCFANFTQIIDLNPTPEHVQQAIQILTSPPPPSLVPKVRQDDDEDLVEGR